MEGFGFLFLRRFFYFIIWLASLSLQSLRKLNDVDVKWWVAGDMKV